MSEKIHTTAVVLIPPEECWEPIQKIRRLHDRKLRRWMPHITLLFPFREREEFDGIAARFEDVCEGVRPFALRLSEFRHFRHRAHSFTLWLAPEPADPLVQLQAALQEAAPDCDDASSHARGFVPHLSVGQAREHETMSALKQTLQAYWQPVSFVVDRVSLVWRREPPDDVFRVDRTIALAGEPSEQDAGGE
jgi:2'-5' RNA ligase